MENTTNNWVPVQYELPRDIHSKLKIISIKMTEQGQKTTLKELLRKCTLVGAEKLIAETERQPAEAIS